MCYHNPPDCHDPDGEELHELTWEHFREIKAAILAGDTKEQSRVYSQFDEWLAASSRAQTNSLVRDSLAGGKGFEKLMEQMVWNEALSRAEPEQLVDKANLRQAAEDDRIANWLDARAA